MSSNESLPGPGRPTALSPEVSAVILKAVEQGLPLSTAADLAGISSTTVNEWIRRGEGRDARPEAPEFAAFAAAYAQSKAKWIQRSVHLINEAAESGEWRAALALLERRAPRMFSINVTSEIAAMLEGLRSRLPPDVLEHVARALQEQEQARAGEGS